VRSKIKMQQLTHHEIINTLIDESTPFAIGLDSLANSSIAKLVGPKSNLTGNPKIDYSEGSKFFDKEEGTIDLRIYYGPDFNYLTAGNIRLEHLQSFVHLIDRCYALEEYDSSLLNPNWDLLDVLRQAQRLDSCEFSQSIDRFKTYLLESSQHHFAPVSDDEINCLISFLKRSIDPHPRNAFSERIDSIKQYLSRTNKHNVNRINQEDLRGIIVSTMKAIHLPPLSEVATHYSFANPSHDHNLNPHILVGGNCFIFYTILSPVFG